MNHLRRCASLLAVASALLIAVPATAEDGAQDGIARNQLERQQRENDFHIKLYDNQVPKPMRSTRGPALPLPLETTPRRVLDLGDPLPLNPTADRTKRAVAPDAPERRQLDASQQDRLQQLQLQNKNLDEPVRQQQTQIQQLQFDRENQAQQLHERILRDSQSSMHQLR